MVMFSAAAVAAATLPLYFLGFFQQNYLSLYSVAPGQQPTVQCNFNSYVSSGVSAITFVPPGPQHEFPTIISSWESPTTSLNICECVLENGVGTVNCPQRNTQLNFASFAWDNDNQTMWVVWLNPDPYQMVVGAWDVFGSGNTEELANITATDYMSRVNSAFNPVSRELVIMTSRAEVGTQLLAFPVDVPNVGARQLGVCSAEDNCSIQSFVIDPQYGVFAFMMSPRETSRNYTQVYTFSLVTFVPGVVRPKVLSTMLKISNVQSGFPVTQFTLGTAIDTTNHVIVGFANSGPQQSTQAYVVSLADPTFTPQVLSVPFYPLSAVAPLMNTSAAAPQ